MPGYLFDTMAHVAFVDSVPDKWSAAWENFRMGRASMILSATLLAEIVQKLGAAKGERSARHRVDWLLGRPNTTFVPLEQRHGRTAGRTLLKRGPRYGLSLADSFALCLAKERGATVFTTDRGLRDACREERVTVSFLPVEELL